MREYDRTRVETIGNYNSVRMMRDSCGSKIRLHVIGWVYKQKFRMTSPSDPRPGRSSCGHLVLRLGPPLDNASFLTQAGNYKSNGYTTSGSLGQFQDNQFQNTQPFSIQSNIHSEIGSSCICEIWRYLHVGRTQMALRQILDSLFNHFPTGLISSHRQRLRHKCGDPFTHPQKHRVAARQGSPSNALQIRVLSNI